MRDNGLKLQLLINSMNLIVSNFRFMSRLAPHFLKIFDIIFDNIRFACDNDIFVIIIKCTSCPVK